MYFRKTPYWSRKYRNTQYHQIPEQDIQWALENLKTLDKAHRYWMTAELDRRKRGASIEEETERILNKGDRKQWH